ncbi:MAG: redox-sensing transcriptional repressor Rex [Candidatus Melainabacteria bacterium RIFOXYA12_FULL_32_12]|nr:MAG: redox-sensing transcriptional repressor Rex [Candidatus Melainabacteria bacterium RIFOXYA2_FULL_32_9]OGI24274.1 MAG: redox-sensing transcriptional repressor Rex [Candidatus Melainabacteria bacterium RIFOXYA12_FULL_32_12]
MSKKISVPTLKRLPNYYNIICQALESGEKYISSAKIAQLLDIDDTQVRKDIAATGYVGKPKVGFDVKEFKAHLEEFLGFNNTKEAFLIGAGNLGIALAKYDGFKKYGLDILSLFDTDPHKVGLKVGKKEVFALSKLPDLVRRMNIQIAILAVPSEVAQDVTDFLVQSGIRAIWNFAPANLKVPDYVLISNQDLAASFVVFSSLISER